MKFELNPIIKCLNFHARFVKRLLLSSKEFPNIEINDEELIDDFTTIYRLVMKIY